MRSATISVVYLSWPSLSCHLRVRRRPSTYTCEPFFRYSPAISASLPRNTIRCHSVSSFFSPLALSFHWKDVATDTLVSAAPSGMYRVSGSRPRLPTRMTLFTDAMSHLSSYQFAYFALIPLPGDYFQVRDALARQYLGLAHAAHCGERFA